jgi:hypothetical protein
MRCFASSLAFFSVLTLQAQPARLAPPEPQTLENIKQFASTHFDPREALSCNQVALPSNTRTITLDFLDPSSPRHGTPTSIDTNGMLQDVFAVSSGTDFEFDHWAMLRGKKVAVYRFSNQLNGKTHAGLVFGDKDSGAISRITFRGTDQTAELFCPTQSR